MPETPDVIGGETVTSDWGNDIRDRTVQRYANTAERSLEHTTPLEGDLSYLEDTNRVYLYNGAAWVPVSLAGTGEVTAAMLAGSAIGGFIETFIATEDADTALTTTLTTMISASINLTTLGWATAKIIAWGSILASVPGGDTLSCRIVIDGNNGPTMSQGHTIPGDNMMSMSAAHRFSTASAGAKTIAIQAAEAAGSAITNRHAVLSGIAIRLT